MKLRQHLPEVIPIQMGVDFGGCDTLMAKHFLNSSQISPSFDQVRGEGVAEGMRTDVLFDPRLLCCLFDD